MNNHSETELINSGRKEVIYQQFTAIYNEENWFKPFSEVLKGISDTGFNYKPSPDINSIREIVNHLFFWNERWLKTFRQESLAPFEKSNDDTFYYFNESESKDSLIEKLLSSMEEWKKALSECNEDIMESDRFFRKNIKPEEIDKWWETLLNINIHNAYHLGQILLLKKFYKGK
ncbi:DinB family protein [soil metagenome]